MINSLPPRINNNVSFKGYDARPLQGFIIGSNYANIGNELKDIGEKEGFKVVIQESDNNDSFNSSWLQDYVHIVNNTVCSFYPAIRSIWTRAMGLTTNPTQCKLLHANKADDWLRQRDILADARELLEGNLLLRTEEGGEQIITEDKFMSEVMALTSNVNKVHVAGGNFFLAKGKSGRDELLIGEDAAEEISDRNLRKMFGVKKIIKVPQAEFHIDMFMRPLNNQRILVADDKMTTQVIEDGLSKLRRAFAKKSSYTRNQKKELNNIYDNLCELRDVFKVQRRINEFCSTREAEKVLKDAGYEIIRVPGRLYFNHADDSFVGKSVNNYIMNYMNANVVENKNGELVYITNKSLLDEKCGLTPEWQEKLDFSFEREFVKSLAPYVKKEHIHFISGDDDKLAKELLYQNCGGIHCLSVEVPYKNEK